ncbi:MAG: PAS domain S-box protein [Hyphomicrobiaceae bacterium]|nr:PAS domain S-box protein [Hyphomicrobiaceae bacterium]
MPRQAESSISSRRAYAIGVGGGLLLLSTVIVGLYLGLETQKRFRDISGSWSAFSESADRKGLLISEIRGHLGYGGIIHDFKNYVLRKDKSYIDAVERRLAGFYASLDAYLASNPSTQERDALLAIRRTIETYQARIPIARQAASQDWNVTQTDRLVKVDDTEAIDALQTLEAVWRASRDSATREIAASVSEGEALISLGFRFLAGLGLVAFLLFALLYLLVRELRDAVRQLATELYERLRAERSEKKLMRAVEQSPATIVITDTNGRIEYVNRRFQDLTGYRLSEVEGRTPSLLQSGDTSADEYGAIRRSLSKGQEWRGVFRNRRKDGTHYWAETTILPLTDADGEIQNFIGIGEDITEKRKAREQIVKAQKMEAVGLLAGGVAHDFNNVLTTILGASHLASLDAEKDSDIGREITQIEIAARRAQSLVQQLLTFARRQPAAPQKLNLQDEVQEVVKLIQASIPPTTKVKTRFETDDAWVLADPTHIHQIVMNLCRNAAEAVPKEAGEIEITVVGDTDAPEALSGHDSDHESWLKLVVTDNGPGLSADTAKRVFDPFFTTKPLGKGTGLGLTMVATLVQDMDGFVSLASQPGEGARFEVTLPRVEAGTVGKVSQEDLPRGSEQILLVDDEADVASTYRRVLMRLGYRVAAYTDPRSALEAFIREPGKFDLVMTDLVMPDMNGETLAHEVLRLKPSCPVILCTGYRPQSMKIESKPRYVLLEKPIHPAELASRLRELLDKAHIPA